MKRLLSLFLLGLLLVSGCTSSGKTRATPVTASLDYSVWDPGRLHEGRTVKLKAVARTMTPVSITIRFAAEGSIEVVDQPAVVFENITRYDSASAWGEFRTNGTFGLGKAIVQVEVRTPDQPTNTTGDEVFFYVTPEEVLGGKGAVFALKRQHLDHLLERGVLTPTQHKKEVKNMSRVPAVPSAYLP